MSLLGEGLEADGQWLRADPVQFIPARDHVLVGATEPLDATELASLAADIARHFELEVKVLDGRLVVRLAAPTAFTLAPTDDVLGRDLGSVLPKGREHLPWLSFINEVQMLLHGSAVNRAREARGMTPVNGLWLWGGGALPAPRPSPFAGIWGGDSLVRGLARLGNGPAPRALPAEASPVLGAGGGRQLIVFPEDADLAALETRWFRPLLDALRRGRVSRVTVHGADGRAFATSRLDLWRFWRRPRPLESYLQ
ncbi:MAG: hypothetical protein AB7U81_11690 [Thiohalomonadaceae bacterium]